MNCAVLESDEAGQYRAAKSLRRYYVPVYRGTYRLTPLPIEALGANHELNRAILDALPTEQGHCAPNMARRVLSLLRKYVPDREYEIVEMSLGGAPCVSGGEHLGYDVSLSFHQSLVWEGLVEMGEANPICAVAPALAPLEAVITVVQDFFRSELNPHGLFSDARIAERYLDCVAALHTVYPSLWTETTSVSLFKVVGLYRMGD